MNLSSLRFFPFLSMVLALGLLWACSAQKNNPFSKSYHNLTAHYNAYFIAKEKLKLVDDALKTAHKNNFNKILLVFAPIDSTIVKSNTENLEDAYKKASMAIQRHQNSNWVDDSYIIVGKVKYLRGEFADAIETFKFVNKTSEDPNTKHRALIELIKAFSDFKEFSNAQAVVDFLNKQKLNNENQKHFALTKAYLYQSQNDIDRMVQSLLIAAPLMKNAEGQAKIYYIIAQIYQSLGYDALAYANYQECLRSNPEYELYFYARLNMAQVTQLAKSSDAKRVRKYFKKLLKDGKNKDFKDKIYFEMAEFEFKQSNIQEAIEFYKQSVRASTTNKRQQGYSYLKIGRIYYDTLKNYSLAKAYYDSTISVLPNDEAIFETIKKRQEILQDFVLQLETIQLQDSLLGLAGMDSVLLDQLLISQVKSKEEKDRENAKSKKKTRSSTNTQVASNAISLEGNTEGGWYFYNVNAISIGTTEFNRKWGERPLQDQWRLSSKLNNMAGSSQVTSSQSDLGEVKDQEPELSEDELLANQIKGFRQNIPFSQEAQKEANGKIEEAFFKLGNIYYFNLEEKPNAAEAFESLLDRYPQSKHAAEVLYQLYLIYKESENPLWEQYHDRLIQDFPNTIYSRLITNPNYREESQSVLEKVKKEYARAFKHYEENQYDSSLSVINATLRDFPENDFSDNLQLLSILINGRREDYYTYLFQLNQFVETNPNSDLLDYAQKLIVAAEKVKEDEKKAKGSVFISDFDQVHFGIIIYEKNAKMSDELPDSLAKFFEMEVPHLKLSTGSLIFNEQFSMILINEMPNKETAWQLQQLLSGDKSPLKEYFTVKIHNFVITKDNFQLFYQSKDISSYLLFFEKNYR